MTIEKLDASSPDLIQQNIERLLDLFPECRTEGPREDAPMVDFDLLRQALSDHLVEGPAERYRLDWPGKRQALLTANTPIDKTLRPMREESVDFDTTRNLFIEGDNLDALKLLQETYLGKVKMIYIDPPYNTGSDFIYRDSFARSAKSYEEQSGQRTEGDGKLVANPESSGRFHSDWLSMMHPRLKLARNLLSDDGVIFISIDEMEADNLFKLLEEIFGRQNHIATIAWQRRTSPDARKVLSTAHDTIHVFGKSSEAAETGIYKLPLNEKDAARFSNQDNDPRGPWVSSDFTAQGYRPNQMYSITTPSGGTHSPPDGRCWKNTEEVFKRLLEEGRMWFGSDGNGVPRVKTYLSERDGKNSWSWWPHAEVGHTQEAKQHINSLLGKADLFETPKPIRLLQRVIELASEPGDLIMDFFGGSASLQHAAWTLADSNSQRYCITVQLDEKIETGNAAEAGFTDVAQLSRARLKHATDSLSEGVKVDTGFRAFRIDSGNLVDTSVTPKEATQEALLGMVSHIKDDRSEEDLLFGALLRWGVDITLPIEQRELAGRKVWLIDAPEDGGGAGSLGGAALIACFAKPNSSGKGGIDTELADAMAVLAPLRVLFRDDGFADDATKENVHSRFKQLAPDTQVRVL